MISFALYPLVRRAAVLSDRTFRNDIGCVLDEPAHDRVLGAGLTLQLLLQVEDHHAHLLGYRPVAPLDDSIGLRLAFVLGSF